MQKGICIFLCWVVIALTSCSKNNNKAILAENSIFIEGLIESDTVLLELPIVKDSAAVIGLKAIIDNPSTSDHHISFGVDPTRLADYQAKYGNAQLLPSNAYLFVRPNCSIAAGKSISDSSELNIVEGTKLKSMTTYVLPVVIRSVDGNTDYAAKAQTLFVVVKTGKAAVISKLGWSIRSVSSQDTWNPANNLLDDDDINSTWATDIGMPQYVELDLDGVVDFIAVTYRTPYPYQGGYPKQVKIETSMDGSNWDDKGTYDGDGVDATKILATGNCTAKYLRFSILSVEPFFSSYDMAIIGGIGLVP